MEKVFFTVAIFIIVAVAASLISEFSPSREDKEAAGGTLEDLKGEFVGFIVEMAKVFGVIAIIAVVLLYILFA